MTIEVTFSANLLDRHNQPYDWQGENVLLDNEDKVQPVIDRIKRAINGMTQDEMLQRARHASAAYAPTFTSHYIAAGELDDNPHVLACLAVLRDLDKPLVDPIDEKLKSLLDDDAVGLNLLRKAYELGKAHV